MNNREKDILCCLFKSAYSNQRDLAERSNYSLGVVNQCIKSLTNQGYLDKEKKLTQKADNEFRSKKPQNAIILAAGFGMRMVPINMHNPKGLLEVNGEPLIERLIRQLHEVDITEIYVIVGFMKEKFEYLIDEYGVELIVNKEYAEKNNIHSLKLASKHLSNTYIVPCDIWCRENPFRDHELYSWYMVSDMERSDSTVKINRKLELVKIPKQTSGNAMIGICYLLEAEAAAVKEKIECFSKEKRYEDCFWEETLYDNDRMIVQGRVVHAADFVEINTYEQLRELDDSSEQLKSDAIAVAAETLNESEKDICNIKVLKKGMTNRSFMFSCKGRSYIMRIPGEGTDQLINRAEEAAVYSAIKEKRLCDKIIYINPDNGYKISEYIENARVCDPMSDEDIKKCMKKLRDFHKLELKVDHEFDLFQQIEFYETLWQGKDSVYRDYKKTKENIYSLKAYIEAQSREKVLTHIDAVPDNFLFINNQDDGEEIYIIDWEYAGMQDPHVDIAMFCIYSLYGKVQIDKLIDIYFEGKCSNQIRIKIYCYIAVCGLLWSNWCEYKRSLGVEFGEYSLRQYRYAKDYYKIVKEKLSEEIVSE